VLRDLGLVWLGTGWRLHAKLPSHHVSKSFLLTISIYKLQTHKYLVDIAVMSGSLVEGMDAAMRIIFGLAANPRLPSVITVVNPPPSSQH
jgi:hypothetical protein